MKANNIYPDPHDLVRHSTSHSSSPNNPPPTTALLPTAYIVVVVPVKGTLVAVEAVEAISSIARHHRCRHHVVIIAEHLIHYGVNTLQNDGVVPRS
jgi:hypothetical protein